MQARLFNDDNTGYDVLVASDAIGMGLNLNIRRIVFHTAIKTGNGRTGPMWVDPSAVRQIAGRAGRLSSGFKYGEVTAWQDVDLAYIRASMGFELSQLRSVGLFPSVEQIEMFGDMLRSVSLTQSAREEEDTSNEEDTSRRDVVMNPNGTNTSESASLTTHTLPSPVKGTVDSSNVTSTDVSEKSIRLSMLMNKFVELAQIDGRYFLCDNDDMIVVSNWLHTIPLSLKDRQVLSLIHYIRHNI